MIIHVYLILKNNYYYRIQRKILKRDRRKTSICYSSLFLQNDTKM